MLLTDLLLFSLWLMIQPRTPMRCALLHQLTTKKMTHRHTHRPIWWRQFFIWESVLPGASSWQPRSESPSGQGQRDEHLLLETSSDHSGGRAAITPEAVSHNMCDAHMHVPLLHSRQLPRTWRRIILVAKRNQSKPTVPDDECSLSLCLAQYHSFWPWMLPSSWNVASAVEKPNYHLISFGLI